MSGGAVRRVRRTTFEMLGAAAREFGSDEAARMAAAIAYQTVFSLAPLLVLATSVAGYVFGPDAVSGLIEGRLTQLLGGDVAGRVQTILASAESTKLSAGLIGLALSVWAGSGVFLQLQAALNDVFEVPKKRTSGVIGMIRRRLLAFAAATGLGIVLLAVLATNAGVAFLGTLIPDRLAWLRSWLGVAGPLLSLLLLIGVLSFVFQYLTALRMPWKAIRRGAFFTGVLFVAGAVGVGAYLRLSPSSTLAAVGALAILMYFIYLMANITLFGAEVTKVYVDYLEHGDVQPPGRRAATGTTRVSPRTPGARDGVWSFLVGLALGWWWRRRG